MRKTDPDILYNRSMSDRTISLEEIKNQIQDHQTEINSYGVKSLAVFGSFARNEATENSDIDVLVEFNRAIGLFEFARVKIYLSELLGREVDLVTVDSLHRRMKETILHEAINVTPRLAH
jgi:predicted nucleotidyltransferase